MSRYRFFSEAFWGGFASIFNLFPARSLEDQVQDRLNRFHRANPHRLPIQVHVPADLQQAAAEDVADAWRQVGNHMRAVMGDERPAEDSLPVRQSSGRNGEKSQLECADLNGRSVEPCARPDDSHIHPRKPSPPKDRNGG